MLENKLHKEGYFAVTTTDPDPIDPATLECITNVIYRRVREFLSPTLHGDKSSDSRRLVRLVKTVESNGHGNLFRAELTGEYRPNGTTETCLVTISKCPISLETSDQDTPYRLEVRVEGMSSLTYQRIVVSQLENIYSALFLRRSTVPPKPN